jgi:hypothetical protein
MILPYFIIIFPTLLVALCIRRNAQRPIIAIYAVISYAYLNLFPTIDLSYTTNPDIYRFSQIQMLIIIAFEIPFFIFVSRAMLTSKKLSVNINTPKILIQPEFNPLIIVLQITLIAVFWYVSIKYDLYFRRVGFEALERNSSSVPSILLYGYRFSVETSFFVSAFSITTFIQTKNNNPFRYLFVVSTLGYVLTFAIFFLINSRMQFLLLLICVFATTPLRISLISNARKMMGLLSVLAAAMIGLTVLRELVFENNNRVSNSSILNSVVDSVGLIAGRLDSMWILTALSDRGFNPLSFNLSGIGIIWDLYYSFVFDPVHYQDIKNSLETSPSAVIINQLMTVSQIDFPKSMVLDVFLSFGVIGLMPLALIVGKVLNSIESQISSNKYTTFYYIAALYVAPMILEFEKETFSIIVSVMKWSPILLLVFAVRPRLVRR